MLYTFSSGHTKRALLLPIHDAVAVEIQNQDWAKDAMEDAWQSVMSEFHKTAKTSVKIQFAS